jgi:hypothetical protein
MARSRKVSHKSKKSTKKSVKPASGEVQIYCLSKCKKNVTPVPGSTSIVTKKTSKRTMKMMFGICPVCKGKLSKIVGGAK